MAAALEQRWGFLAPWCQLLSLRLSVRALEAAGDQWEAPARALRVLLPRRAGVYGELRDEREFQLEFQNAREALCLLAAVGYVDHTAWKFLLTKYCGLQLEHSETEIPVRYELLLEPLAEALLIDLCGAGQRRSVSVGYVNTLERIAQLGGIQKAEGVDLEIPVRVFFTAVPTVNNLNNKMATEPIQTLLNIQAAEKVMRETWEHYNWSLENQPVVPGTLRCTLVLEPMIADLRGFGCGSDIAETMARFVGENVWFSQLLVRAERRYQPNQSLAAMSLRQMMAVVFDAKRQSQELANTKYCSQVVGKCRKADPLQMGTVTLECDASLGDSELEAIASALVLNQTTKDVTIRMRLDPNDHTSHRVWWKWVAYAFFSKRAHACSALESLVLDDVDDMDIDDMKAFSAVQASEHPEEVLCGSGRALVAESNAVLKQGAPVQWQLQAEGKPGSQIVKFGSEIPFILVFSDDGESNLVNVLIPGFGRCLVRRYDLDARDVHCLASQQPRLTSLTIRFSKFSQPSSNGLPLMLSACGSSLQSLTIQNSTSELDENLILRCCPNLRHLSLHKGCVVVGFDFTEFRIRKETVPLLYCNWRDIALLAHDLSDPNNPFCKCAYRLSIRLTDLDQHQTRWVQYEPMIASYLNELLEMLAVNKNLEFFKLTVPAECHEYGDYFRKHHNKVIDHKLSQKVKAALLSVLYTRLSPPSSQKSKRTRRTRKSKKAPVQPSPMDTNRHVFKQICAFTTGPTKRQVLFEVEYTGNAHPKLC
ncbi:unnamed protein product [Phytophthora lilii]|uniref:Unnamed protein product n=1 Tax=Phytophthora lilii TaxID=2077276 RepID=A0A9W6TWT6_9STRA|nr:unnamed protein product [Phytophthora lilii]